MIKAHKIRLHPTSEQANYFTRAAGTARFVFNGALAEWKAQYEAGGKPNATALKMRRPKRAPNRRLGSMSDSIGLRRFQMAGGTRTKDRCASC